jgi:hypothetical protein
MSLNYMVDSVEFEGQMNGDSKIRFSSSLLHEYHLIIQNKPKFILVLYLTRCYKISIYTKQIDPIYRQHIKKEYSRFQFQSKTKNNLTVKEGSLLACAV